MLRIYRPVFVSRTNRFVLFFFFAFQFGGRAGVLRRELQRFVDPGTVQHFGFAHRRRAVLGLGKPSFVLCRHHQKPSIQTFSKRVGTRPIRYLKIVILIEPREINL